MRILYSHRVHSRDGQSVHIDELIKALQHAGHEVRVAGPNLYERAEFGGESRLVPALRRCVPAAFYEVLELLYNLPALMQARRTLRGFAPELIYERYNLYFFCGMLLKHWLRIPLYLEVNSPLAAERSRYGGLRLRALAARCERAVWRSADRVFVVTAALGDIVAAAGVTRDRIVVTPNGIDLAAFPATPYLARPGVPVTIGFIGFVREWHGVDAVVEGLAADRTEPPIRLVVAGDGPARPALERQTTMLGIPHLVEFTGLQPRSRVAELIASFDIALQPRAVSYASPLKLFEYMACGRAIVAPDQPNIREIIDNGETGVLFDPDEPGALWRAIRALAADPARRERLGRAARVRLEERNYTWAGNAARITALAADDIVPRADAAPPMPPLGRFVPRQTGRSRTRR
ncbi:MAG TPA: glycosyltransferase family 4 protein [Stellaceae bacterium]|nr:glycosyltransferase family 4 protein [Stellaceae bacterium]